MDNKDEDGRKLAQIDTKLDSLIISVSSLNKLLHGNGTPGMKTELDRLKQRDIQRERLVSVLLAAIIGLAVNEAISFISGIK